MTLQLIARGNPGVILLDRVYVGPVVQAGGAPIIDGATCRSTRHDGGHDWWAGLCFTRSTVPAARGWVIARPGRYCPRPDLWRWVPSRLTRGRSR